MRSSRVMVVQRARHRREQVADGQVLHRDLAAIGADQDAAAVARHVGRVDAGRGV